LSFTTEAQVEPSILSKVKKDADSGITKHSPSFQQSLNILAMLYGESRLQVMKQ